MAQMITHLQRVIVVKNLEPFRHFTYWGLEGTYKEYNDLALMAAQFTGAAASIILIGDGKDMREAGHYSRATSQVNAGSSLPTARTTGPYLQALTTVPVEDSKGKPIGVICVLDETPFDLSPVQLGILEALARQIATVIELRLENTTDALTGLANRRAFDSCLTREVERSRRYGAPLSLLMIDVDDFKGYNDAFGHPAGDEVLKRLAYLLSKSVRASDLTARCGGEEFAIIVPENEIHGALFLAERCRYTIEALHWPNRSVTVSIGVASMPPCTKDGDDLLKAADQALYQAKRRGGNRLARAVHAWFKAER